MRSAQELEDILRTRNRMMLKSRLLSPDTLLRSDTAYESEASSDNADGDKEEDSDDDSSSSSSSDDEKKKKSKKAKKSKKKKSNTKNAEANGAMDISKLATLLSTLSKPGLTPPSTTSASAEPLPTDTLLLPPVTSTTSPVSASASEIAQQVVHLLKQEEQAGQDQKAPGKIGTKVAFKRVDQVYDRKIHNYKLKETVQGDTQHDKWDQVIPLFPCVSSSC